MLSCLVCFRGFAGIDGVGGVDRVGAAGVGVGLEVLLVFWCFCCKRWLCFCACWLW